MWCEVIIVFSSHSEGNGPKAWVLLTAPSPAKLTLALKVVILIHWSPAGSAKDKWHLADDASSFETSSEIFHHQQKGRWKKCLLSYPVDGVCLPTCGYPNKHGKNMHGYWFPAVIARLIKRVLGEKQRGCSIIVLFWLLLYTLSKARLVHVPHNRLAAERHAVYVVLWAQSNPVIEVTHCLH